MQIEKRVKEFLDRHSDIKERIVNIEKRQDMTESKVEQLDKAMKSEWIWPLLEMVHEMFLNVNTDLASTSEGHAAQFAELRQGQGQWLVDKNSSITLLIWLN